MAAFVGPSSQEIVKDGDKTNNRLSNLEYAPDRRTFTTPFRMVWRLFLPGGGKLTEEMVRQIKKRLEGERVSRIAPDFGVSPECISAIKHQKTWAWLKC